MRFWRYWTWNAAKKEEEKHPIFQEITLNQHKEHAKQDKQHIAIFFITMIYRPIMSIFMYFFSWKTDCKMKFTSFFWKKVEDVENFWIFFYCSTVEEISKGRLRHGDVE